MSTLPLRQIAADVCVAPQLHPDAMSEAARMGFRSVVNNRPDFEHDNEQPTSAAMEAAAKAAGLTYHHLPVSGAFQTPEEAQAMARILASTPHPVLMFCRSGARSAKLYELAKSA